MCLYTIGKEIEPWELLKKKTLLDLKKGVGF